MFWLSCRASCDCLTADSLLLSGLHFVFQSPSRNKRHPRWACNDGQELNACSHYMHLLVWWLCSMWLCLLSQGICSFVVTSKLDYVSHIIASQGYCRWCRRLMLWTWTYALCMHRSEHWVPFGLPSLPSHSQYHCSIGSACDIHNQTKMQCELVHQWKKYTVDGLHRCICLCSDTMQTWKSKTHQGKGWKIGIMWCTDCTWLLRCARSHSGPSHALQHSFTSDTIYTALVVYIHVQNKIARYNLGNPRNQQWMLSP